MKAVLLSVLLVVDVLLLQAQEKKLTTLIVFRHAEKNDDGSKDPDLSEKGNLRAQQIAAMLKNADVAAVYSSNYRRTKNTVTPLCSLKNLTLSTYDPSNATWVDEMLKQFRGKTVVICGHSNTIPPMINRIIKRDEIPPIADDSFNDLFIVTLDEVNAVVTRLKQPD